MPQDAARFPEGLLAHAGFVRALARATLRGDPECEDLEQDVWHAAIRGAPSEPARQRPWLVAVLRRRAADMLRGRHRRARRERAAAGHRVEPSASDAVERAETGRRLVHAVLGLEEPFRSAVLLRFLDGLPPRAVAARLGVPVETVRSRVRRGLGRLRQALEEGAGRERRDARAALAALAFPDLVAAGGALSLFGGALVAKKAVLAAGVLLLLGGTAWFAVDATRPLGGNSRVPPPTARVGEESRDTAPTLQAAAAPTIPSSPAAPSIRVVASAEARVVRGRVVGPEGQPIAGAVVRGVPWIGDVLGAGLLRGDATAWPSGRSDAQGRFELPISDEMGNGMTVLVQAEGWSQRSSGLGAPPGVFLAVGQEVTITLERGVPLEVRVLADGTGAPVAGATVAVYRSHAWILWSTRPEMEATTDEGGRAAMRAQGGEVRWVVTSQGFAQVEGQSLNLGPTGGAATVRLRRGGALDVEVVDLAGRRVPGARVALLRAPAAFRRAVSDAEGRVRFENVATNEPGRERVRALTLALIVAEADGYVRSWAEADPAPEGGRASVRLTLLSPRTLRGRARYADGAPAADLFASATTTQGGSEWGFGSQSQADGARTDAEGAFEIGGVAPGRVTVRVGPAGSVESKGEVDVAAEGPVAPVDLVVARGVPPVHVRVIDDEGRGVPRAAVSVMAEEEDYDGAQHLTGPDGRIAFQPRLTGPWWLFVDAPGAGPLLRRLEVAEAARGPVEVGPGPHRVDGRVLRLDGSPARVRLAFEVTRLFRETQVTFAAYAGAVDTDEQGRFAFAGVHDGVQSLRCLTPGWLLLPGARGVTSRSRDLRPTAIDEAEAAGLRVEVEVLDAGGGPLDVSPTVTLSREGQVETGFAFALRVAGSPSLQRTQGPLAPGTWRLSVEAKGYEAAESDVTLSPGRPAPRVQVLLRKAP